MNKDMGLTTLKYKALIQQKYGITLPMTNDELLTMTTNVEHNCSSCGIAYTSTPALTLSEHAHLTCIKCAYQLRQSTRLVDIQDYAERLRKKFDYITCLEFNGLQKGSRFQCECGYSWKAKSIRLLKSKIGCPVCYKTEKAIGSTMSVSQLKAKLAKTNFAPIIDKTEPIFLRKKAQFFVRIQCKNCKNTHYANAFLATCSSYKCQCEQQTEYSDIESLLLSKLKTRLKLTKLIHKPISHSVEYCYQKRVRQFIPNFCYNDISIVVATENEISLNFDKFKLIAKTIIATKRKFKLYCVLPDSTVTLINVDWKKIKEFEPKHIRQPLSNCIRVLAFDPGSTNFAWSVIEVTRPFNARLLATGMLLNTIKEIKNHIDVQISAFEYEVTQLCTEYKVDHLIAERFMYRMGIKGITMELVNIMIGSLQTLWAARLTRPNTLLLVTAAQWKNEWNRLSDLKSFYNEAKCTVHQVDSIGIGLYGAACWLNVKPFCDIVNFEKELIQQIRECDLEKY